MTLYSASLPFLLHSLFSRYVYIPGFSELASAWSETWDRENIIMYIAFGTRAVMIFGRTTRSLRALTLDAVYEGVSGYLEGVNCVECVVFFHLTSCL